ncbi:MHO_1580 family protein [Metamycoplasma buccale]|uniref:MHO_1580 family protein n=1 Tax=Metamycoplasma buccale TaxID=55602 RepID=UPI00398E4964
MLIPNNIQEHNFVNIYKNEIKEEIVFNAKKIIFKSDYINSNENFKLSIRRVIETDEIILQFIFNNSNSKLYKPEILVNINNNPITFYKVSNNQSNGKYIYQSILAKEKGWSTFKFSNLKSINIEIFNHHGWKNKEIEKLYEISYYISKKDLNSSINLDNGIGNIKLLTKLNIGFYNVENLDDSLIENSDIQYLNFSLKPIKLKQGIFIKKIYDIKISKQWEKSKAIEEINHSDLNGLKISNLTKNENIIGDLIFDNGKTQISEINIISSSYYDYKTKKTIITNENLNAKKGLIIPLNFEGNFTHKLSLDFGLNLKNILVIYNQMFNNPFFSFRNGLIKLNLVKNNDKNFFSSWHTIKYENIKNIVKENLKLDEIAKEGEK